VPALPECLLEPLWDQFAALLPARPAGAPTHPLGCHRRRVPDRVVFDHVVAALVHGSGDERIASPGCSDRTIRRRLRQWAAAGLSEQLHALALRAYDRMTGLELEDVAVDGCTTKAPSGGEAAGRSPVDRGKQGLKRSVATDGAGVPLHLVSAGANRHDAPLLGPTLAELLAWLQDINWPVAGVLAPFLAAIGPPLEGPVQSSSSGSAMARTMASYRRSGMASEV
jgi:hypothetical protein